MNNSANIQLLCVTDPQRALAASLAARNLKHFQYALNCGADSNCLDHSTGFSIFEYVCQTPGYSEFIVECIRSGADVQKPNADGRYPIHFVSSSSDPDNVRALLDNAKLNVDVAYQDQTALHMLFERITENNWKDIFGCIKLLIRAGADVNIPNEDNRTAIGVFVKDSKHWEKNHQQWRKEILSYCLNKTVVDVDSFRKKELRTKIEEYFPGVVIPAYTMEPSINILKAHIKSKAEKKFTPAFQRYKETKDEASWNENLRELMKVAVHSGVLSFVTQLHSEDYRFGADSNFPELLKTCCNYGYHDILAFLLKNTDRTPADIKRINTIPLLSLVIKEINILKDRSKCPFFKCLEILLADERIEIDKTDEKGFSALHYAVKYKVDAAVDMLLKHSAYIGTQNMFKELPICEMNPTILEEYLDSCITTNEKRPGDDEYEININFSCLVPPVYKKNHTQPEQANAAKRAPEGADEMVPLVYMANSSDLKHLLKHPVISSYVLIKWLRLSIYFYINLLICTTFFVSFTWYVVGCYGQDNVHRGLKEMLRIISLIGTTYMLIREIGQMTLHGKKYFASIENWMEITLIVTSYAVLLKEFASEYRQMISAIVILLSAVEFTLLVGTLPVLSISTHMVMLKTVSKNFLKSLVLYSIILISFAFCFYTLFNVNNAAQSQNQDATAEPESEDEKFNTFGNIGTAMLKTIVMLTGEFEAANIKFQINGVSYVIFVLFLFFGAIVIFNLMNGLAVSDTATIKAEAELIGLSQKVDVISKYENAIRSSSSTTMLTKIVFHVFPANFLQLFPDFIPRQYIIVAPNQNNTIYIPVPQKQVETESVIDVESHIELLQEGATQNERFKLSFGCCILPSFSRMDNKIMKYAKETIHARGRKSVAAFSMTPLEERLLRLERNIELVLDHLSKSK